MNTSVEQSNPVFFIAIVVVLVLACAIIGFIMDRKRRQAMSALATRLGLTYDPQKDYNTASQFRFLDKLAQGNNRYAFNSIYGEFKGHIINAFDYHYETHSTDSKGRRHTHHHYFSFFILQLPRAFQELTIVKEGIFSKIAQTFGYEDIDFESAEFSRTFCVRSPNKKFAYDVCNARMMDYLLNNKDLSIEIESNALALAFDTRLSAEEIEANLNRLVEIREKIGRAHV
jgi:hypothetical protein